MRRINGGHRCPGGRSHLLHGVDFLVDELRLGQQRVSRRVVFLEFGSQPFGVGQYLLYGDGHGVFEGGRGEERTASKSNCIVSNTGKIMFIVTAQYRVLPTRLRERLVGVQ